MKTQTRTTIISLLAIMCGAVVHLSAQQAILNIEGFVRDSVSGEPVGCKLHINFPSGKKVSISSNSKDGSYLQTLSEAGPHRIVAAGFNVYRKEFIVDVPKTEKFKVIKQDFTVRAFVEGRQLSSTMAAFDRNAATLTEPGRKALADLADVMKANQHLNVVVRIMADEDQLAPLIAQQMSDYNKRHDAWAKAVKKVKKGQPLPEEPQMPAPPADPNAALVESRNEAVRQALKDVKLGDVRVTFQTKAIATAAPVAEPVAEAPAAKGKKGKKAAPAPAPAKAKVAVSTEPSLVVTIGKIKSMFD
ncbi:MAG: hypothetical protein FGM33_01300 [Candidatus Kapabacteria bacterium]|nr:hypothetical protein [Candidatus Kapabacteria bacterium]